MSRIRANQITNQAADGAPTVQHGLIIAGVSTFTGSVSIGGTLTYEDVTNIDSIGIVTARQGIHIDDSIVHIGDTDTKIRFLANDTVTVETAGSERVRIDSTGHTTVHSGAHDKGLDILPTANSRETRLRIQGKASDGTAHTFTFAAKSSANRLDISGTGSMCFIGSQNVGVQNAAPTSPLHVGSDVNPHTTKALLFVGPASGDSTVHLRGGSPTLFFDPTGGGHTKILTDGADLAISNGTIDNNATEILRIPSTGGIELKTDGKGIQFPTTQTPTNAGTRVGISSEMRYYETGTFVPGLSSTVLNSLQLPAFTDASYARRIGRYVRCGHLVFCNIEFLMASSVTYANGSTSTAPPCIVGVTPFYYAYARRFAVSGEPDYNPCSIFYSSSGLDNNSLYAVLRREYPGQAYIQITKPGTGGSNQYNSKTFGEVFPANAHIAVSYTYAIDSDNADY